MAVIDNELAGMVSRGLNGIKVNNQTIALNEIESVILGEKKGLLFLGLKHTANNIKNELFIPSLSERSSRNTWIKKGALDIVEKAQIKVKEILKSHKIYALGIDLENRLDEYIKKVKKRNINEYVN